jgi:hypothetical protein
MRISGFGDMCCEDARTVFDEGSAMISLKDLIFASIFSQTPDLSVAGLGFAGPL